MSFYNFLDSLKPKDIYQNAMVEPYPQALINTSMKITQDPKRVQSFPSPNNQNFFFPENK